ncbi:MAG: isochorismate synthase [Sporolactobacillus sp.]
MNNVIDTIEKRWLQGLRESAARAARLKKPVLFSDLKKVNTTESLLFFEKGRALYGGKRFVFHSSDLFLVGLGAAYSIKANGNSRFDTVRNEWKEINEQMLFQKEAGADPAALPILFGGFSFDTASAHGSQWAPFSDASFILPVWLLRIQDRQASLTHTILCPPEAEPEQLLSQFVQEEEALTRMESPQLVRAPQRLSQKENQNRQQWRGLVNAARQQMRSSALNKVVLARTRQITFSGPLNPGRLLEKLAARQQENYLFCLETGGRAFLGATPERLVKKRGQRLDAAGVAGSAPRGENVQADRLLANELFADSKNRQEHQYVVTMVTQALQKLASDLDFPEEPLIMKNKNIQHLYTPVRARAHASVSIFDLVKALHPTPALGGAPREAALRWLRVNEQLDRGFYGAPIGWCDAEGNGEFVVAIRSALISGNEATLYAGCGVLEASDPDMEYEETALKFRPMMDVLPGEDK